MPSDDDKKKLNIDTSIQPTSQDSIASYFGNLPISNTKIPLLSGVNEGNWIGYKENTPLEWLQKNHPNVSTDIEKSKEIAPGMTEEDMQSAMNTLDLKGTSDVLDQINLKKEDLPNLIQLILPKDDSKQIASNRLGGRTQVSSRSTYKKGGNVPGMFNGNNK